MFQERFKFCGSVNESPHHIKPSIIAQSEQYQHEVRAWKRILEFLREENVNLKNCLADILKNEVNTIYIEKAEYFLNKFLDQDELMKLVCYDIKQYQKLLVSSATDSVGDPLHIINKQMRLRIEMERIEQEYSKLKFSFYNYLSEVFSNMKQK